MTNVTPRRSRILHDGDSEDAEVAWDFGSASPRSRLALCKQYDRLYSSANEELRDRLVNWFPETSAEPSDSPQRKLVYEPRVPLAAADSPVSSRERRAQQRQRRKDKALRELQAVVQEINQVHSRVSASPVLQCTPKLWRSHGHVAPDPAANADALPCQLFADAAGGEDVLKDLSDNVDDIFKLSQEELEQILSVENEPLTLASNIAPCRQGSCSVKNAYSDTTGASAVVTRSKIAKPPGTSRASHAANMSPPPTPQQSLAPGTSVDSAPGLQGANGAQRNAPSAGHASDNSSCIRCNAPAPACRSSSELRKNCSHTASLDARPNPPQALHPAAPSLSSQQKQCTQQEIERKRRLAKQKLLKRNFSTAHGASQTAGSRR